MKPRRPPVGMPAPERAATADRERPARRIAARARAARRLLLAAALACLPVAATAQLFDNFEQTPLPPLPEGGGDRPADGEDLLDAPWLDGEGAFVPDAGEGGIRLDTETGGQTGVLLETYPGTGGPATSVSRPATRQGDRITLRALDRMLGRPTDLELVVGQTVLFGRIAIHVPECRFPAENPSSDAFAHLRVFDTGGNALFDGWMVASSPALSALEHPRYDVWVLRCASTS